MAYQVTKVFTRPNSTVRFFNDYTDASRAVLDTFKAQSKLVSDTSAWSDNWLQYTSTHVWASQAAYEEFTSQPAQSAVFAARDSHNSANGITCTITTATI
jgi:hypothetical protein